MLKGPCREEKEIEISKGHKEKKRKGERRERNGDCQKKMFQVCFCGDFSNFWSRRRPGQLW